ncbi:MAG: hypothetical protein IKD70_05840 [Eggerthellaceae bacterium]|nr:hypothetical protein [Eggerthellaceae bacterium]
MSIVISHKSAWRFWRTFAGNRAALPKSRRSKLTDAPVPLTADLLEELASLSIPVTANIPLDLLFSTTAVRSRAKRIRAHHTSRPLPPASLIPLSDHVFVTCPELTFFQIAGEYSMAQLAMIGAELCGTYRLFDASGVRLAHQAERRPITAPDAIIAYGEALGLAGNSPAFQAARHVPENAASPMEAMVALLLALPRTRGGYGLPAPILNHPVPLGKEAALMYPHSPCRCDLYWPDARLDVEYEGREAHETAFIQDSARRAALMQEQIDVIVLTKQQVYDAEVFDAVATLIAGKLGVRIRFRGDPGRLAAARRALRKELGLS